LGKLDFLSARWFANYDGLFARFDSEAGKDESFLCFDRDLFESFAYVLGRM
jgi:hypothetical protein